MSGGVDSSTSAIVLQQNGYEVIGCTMNLWNQNEEENKAIIDAKEVCEKLGIEHYVLNCEDEFKCHVVDQFIREYTNARTPNPCVECNKYLKFGYFYEKAKELNCNYIATGHYARIEYSEKYNQYVLKKSNEEVKDQTYFLYTITKERLEHIVFPLQEYLSKEDIRKIAEDNGLKIAHKKESQEICFIPDNDYQNFLHKHGELKNKKGKIVLTNGEELGTHNGLTNYTIGQRKGLGISYKKPLYVIKLDKDKNQVIVGEEEKLYNNVLYANRVNWIIDFKENDFPIKCKAKIRYRAKEAEALVYQENDQVKVEFIENQRAITPGQSVVFYDYDGIVLGGGKICDF